MPRLLSLKDAKEYLAGLDPRALGVSSVTTKPLRFDREAINRRLDEFDPSLLNDNQVDGVADELKALRERIKGDAAGT